MSVSRQIVVSCMHESENAEHMFLRCLFFSQYAEHGAQGTRSSMDFAAIYLVIYSRQTQIISSERGHMLWEVIVSTVVVSMVGNACMNFENLEVSRGLEERLNSE